MASARRIGLAAASLLACVAVPGSSALAATHTSSAGRPTIRSVTPLTANVGDQLTIKGRNFAVGTKRNRVTFKVGGKTITVKAGRSTRTRMRVVIPQAVARYMTVKDGVAQPTRFRLRIRAKRTGKRFTALGLSPRIGLLSSSLDAAIGGTEAVNPSDDCDGDGVIGPGDDVVIETDDGAQSRCAADNNGDPTAGDSPGDPPPSTEPFVIAPPLLDLP